MNADGLNASAEISINGLKDNITNYIKKKLDDIKLNNDVRKDDEAIKQAKLSNKLSFLAIALAVISMIISLYK